MSNTGLLNKDYLISIKRQGFADLVWNLFIYNYKLAKKRATKSLYEESADA